MTPDTADPAIQAVRPSLVVATGELVPALDRIDPARALAIRAVWRALWTSRLLVWLAGSGAMLAFGFGPVRNAFDPRGVTRGLGSLGGLLAAPAARWDAAWYLVIAHYGYRPDLGAFTSSRTAFFPLYPLGLGAIARLGLPPIAAGVLLSVVALALALYGIHRLTTLELARAGAASSAEVARLAVLLTAFAPMAFFFSAVYSESLYLALSVGLFLCARRGRWVWVGVLGTLATATNGTGIVLLAPAAMLYLYGPREDRVPDFQVVRSRIAPRYRLRRDFLWLGLVPAGVGLYMAYLAFSGGEALMPFHAQDVWGRRFAGPYLGVWDGVKAAFAGARQLLSFQRAHVYFPAAGGSPDIVAGHNLMLLAFLGAAVPMVVGVWRMLPRAYGVYVIAALALPLSYPVASQPLMSLPRFLVVLFPLSIWLGAWLAAHPRARTPVLVGSGVLLVFFVAQFATWHWVA
jgi:Mannosyltransferase (PIG-V)